jgi:Tfp pilus assembly protein PilV
LFVCLLAYLLAFTNFHYRIVFHANSSMWRETSLNIWSSGQCKVVILHRAHESSLHVCAHNWHSCFMNSAVCHSGPAFSFPRAKNSFPFRPKG